MPRYLIIRAGAFLFNQMAVKYFKLGPIGKYFNDSSLGIYLSATNGFEIDDTYLDYRLKNFIQTGYLVEITKLEYDNLKIAGKNARNIPLAVVDIGKNLYIDPVEIVTAIPDSVPSIGARYIVYREPKAPWIGKRDLIAVWNGSTWDYITPVNGNICPVYRWGVAVEYKGTYPSGFWDYSTQLVELIEAEDGAIIPTPIPPTDGDYYIQLINQERDQRIAADDAIWLYLNNNPVPAHRHWAADIDIADQGNYYNSTTVEGALQEVGTSLAELRSSISNLQEQIDNLGPSGQQVREYVLEGLSTYTIDHDLGKIPNTIIVWDRDKGVYILVVPDLISATQVIITFHKIRNVNVTLY